MRRDIKDPTENLPKDMAHKIAGYLKNRNDYFAFSGANRKLRHFFQSERENAIKIAKIRVKKNTNCSFLHAFDGQLFVCGWLSVHLSVNQWTQIGPPGKKISEFVFNDTDISLNLFVRCNKNWYQMGGKISEWLLLRGPKDQEILELIPARNQQAFIRCPDNGWYVCSWSEGGSLMGRIFRSAAQITYSPLFCKQKPDISASTKILEIVTCHGRDFIRCTEGLYASGRNANGELGIGNKDDQKDWIKVGPPDKKVLQLKANDVNTVVLCDDGLWYGCGQNNHGQLGLGHRKNLLNWRVLGSELKDIKSVFLQEKRIFIHCTDGLYAAGAVFSDNSVDLKNWTKLGFANTEILEIFGATNATFIRCSDGWYYLTGDNRAGIFGLYLSEQVKGRWTWEKLTCGGEEILQLVPSQEYAYAACKDGWYFTGSNSHGVNGMNDDLSYRSRWMRMFSHGEDIVGAQGKALIKKTEVEGTPALIRLKQALKKLYEPETLVYLQNNLREFCAQHLNIGYDKNYPAKHGLYFFFPPGSLELYSARAKLLEERIKEILDYPYVYILREEDFNNHLFLRVRVFVYPSPSISASLLPENTDELIDFLKKYEENLDNEEDIKAEPILLLGI